MAQIIMLLYGQYPTDQRVAKEINSISKFGHNVILFTHTISEYR